jgi:hypothetical protein
MKAPIVKSLLFSAAAGLSLGLLIVARAQETKERAEKLVDFGSPSTQAQFTPDWEVKNVTKKRWKPKEWLEFEIPFEAKPPSNKRDLTVFDALTFKFYLYLENPDPKKRKILTADVPHVNVPVGESMASVVYLSPSAIFNLTGKSRVEPTMVSRWGVEVFNGTQLVGFASSQGKSPTAAGAEWWKIDNAPPQTPGLLMNKAQTPFAPLWGDYHAEVQTTR